MGKIKGCANESCAAYRKKIKYKETERYCSICASPLIYMCKDCYTLLLDDAKKYCVRCYAKHQDKNEKIKKVAKGAGVAVGGVILTAGKIVFDVVKKAKGG